VPVDDVTDPGDDSTEFRYGAVEFGLPATGDGVIYQSFHNLIKIGGQSIPGLKGVWNLRKRQFPQSEEGLPRMIGETMIVLGVILLVIGYFTGLSILYTIGGILLVIGVVLWILGAVGRPVGGRKVWF
jgi:hypothetical protein